MPVWRSAPQSPPDERRPPEARAFGFVPPEEEAPAKPPAESQAGPGGRRRRAAPRGGPRADRPRRGTPQRGGDGRGPPPDRGGPEDGPAPLEDGTTALAVAGPARTGRDPQRRTLRRPQGDRAAGPLSRRVAGDGAAGRTGGDDPRSSGRRRLRGDRLRQEHAVAQDLPGPRPRRGGDDRPHPAPPDRRPQRRQPGGGGAGRLEPARRPQGAVHGPDDGRHPRQADDRRRAAGGNAVGPVPEPLRHDHRRRGPRAEPQHRLPARLPQTAAAQAAGPAGDRHQRHDRRRPLQRVFWSGNAGDGRTRIGGVPAGAGDRGERPHLPGGGPLPPAAGAGRKRPPAGAGGAPRGRRRGGLPRGAGRRAGVRADGAGDPRRLRRAPRPAVPGGRLDGDPAALRAAVGERAAKGVQAVDRPAGRGGDERGGVLADGARRAVRRGRRHRPDQPLRRPHGGAAPSHRSGLQGQRPPAGRALRAGGAGRLRAAVFGGGLREPRGVHPAGDSTQQSRRRDPPDGDAAAGDDRRVPAARPAPPGQRAGRLRDADGDRRPGRRIPPHRSRPHAGDDAGRPEDRPDGRRRGGRGRAERGAGDRQRVGDAGSPRSAGRQEGRRGRRPTPSSYTPTAISSRC